MTAKAQEKKLFMLKRENQGIKNRLIQSAGPVGKNTLAIFSLLLIDLLAVGVSLQFAFALRGFFSPMHLPAIFSDALLANTLHLLWWFPLAFIFCLAYEKLYVHRISFWVEAERIARACTLALFMAIAFIYLTGIATFVSRSIVLMIWFMTLFLIPTFRFYGKKLLLRLKIWNRPLVLLGDRKAASQVFRALNRETNMGYELVGFIHTGRQKKTEIQILPCLGPLLDAETIIQELKGPDLIITVPGLPIKELIKLTARFQPLVNNIMVVPDLFGMSFNSMDISYFFEEQAMLLHVKNRLRSTLNRAIKRCFDIAFGLGLLSLSLPMFLIIAIAIKLDSRGPVFYIHQRIGQGSRNFQLYKFRTMYTNADEILMERLATCPESCWEWQKYKKLKIYDPRVTRIGRLLRRLSLDELPQLINILRNEMSFVGPRPYLPIEAEMLSQFSQDILITKPGLTGLWQISGRNNLTFDSRLRLDTWYVKNWSLWLDIILLLKTIKVILKAEGAY
jgi:Undecaprenyl-phosphate galactose phosphotransferase WbaP